MTEPVATPAPPPSGSPAARRVALGARAMRASPRTVLAVLVAAQVLSAGALGLLATHNGWAWFQGGDQMWYATDGWLLGGFHLPPGLVSYGWPLVLMPITLVTGPTWLQAMPVIAALNLLVLGPVALLGVYGIATRLAGSRFGLFSAFLWLVAPFASIPLWVERYRDRWIDEFLPQGLGLTALADYPSMVALLLGALLVLRAIDGRSWTDACVAGLVVGYAGAMKPPNLLFLGGAALAFLAARRWREGAVFAISLAPALLTLMFWKYRALGEVPLLTLPNTHQAAGDGAVGLSVDRYVDLDWDHWRQQMAELREFNRVAPLIQLMPVAGAFALALIRRWAGLGLLVGWLAAFLAVKGTAPQAGIEVGSFFRLLMPAWPAYLLLAASVVLLVPWLRRWLGAQLQPGPVQNLSRGVVAACALVLVVTPLVIVAAARPISGPEHAVLQRQPNLVTILTPVDAAISPRLRRDGQSVVLSWDVDHPWRANVTYVVLRATGPGQDVSCVRVGVTECTLTMSRLGETTFPGFVDPAPPPGATYRVGVAVDYRDQPGGDIFAISRPVTVPG